MAIVRGVAIQDFHFGHKRTEEMYHELEKFTNFVKDNEIHILNINGDYFDRKLSATEPAIYYAITYFDELMKICREKKIKVRVMLGTRSHDLNQYSTLFQHYFTDPTLDIRYIPTVQTEEIIGLKVLYIPEEYPEDGEAYYEEFKKGKYNIIHGHGTWDFVSFVANFNHEEHKKEGVRTAPIFKYDEWKDSIEEGFSIFGHIHQKQSHKNVHYAGSYTSWGFGDPSEKSFLYYEIDTETNKYKLDFIINEKAPTYQSTSVKALFKDRKLSELSVEEVQNVIKEQSEKYDNVKINVAGLSDDKIQIFRKAFEENKNVKIENKKRKKATLKENVEPAIYERYGYILERELPLNETVQKFIKDEMGETIDLEKVKELLQ